MRVVVMMSNVFVKRVRNSMMLLILQLKKISFLEIKAVVSIHRHQYQLKKNGATMAKKQNQDSHVVVMVKIMQNIMNEENGGAI